jgi:hypothetical protein
MRNSRRIRVQQPPLKSRNMNHRNELKGIHSIACVHCHLVLQRLVHEPFTVLKRRC